MPDTTALSGTFFTTTEFGATITLSPIVTPPIILQPIVKSTLLPIIAKPPLLLLPTITPALAVQLCPTDLQLIITPPLNVEPEIHIQQHLGLYLRL